MTKYNKAILHCGGGKTGSTKLQFVLDASRAALLNENILAYPPGITHSDLANTVLEHPSKYIYNDIWRHGISDAELFRIGDIYLKHLDEWLSDAPACNYLMFSCEAFCTLNSEDISKLFTYLKKWSKEQILLFYVRDPVSFALSAYSQNIKQGITPELPIFDWKSSLENMENGSGRNMLVRKYESCLDYENGIVDDFANIFEIPRELIFDIGRDAGSNMSLTAEAAALGLAIIKKLERDNVTLNQSRFFTVFGSILSGIGGEKLKMPHDMLARVIEASQPTYEVLQNRYHINYDSHSSMLKSDFDSFTSGSLSFNETAELLVNVYKNLICSDVIGDTPGEVAMEVVALNTVRRIKADDVRIKYQVGQRTLVSLISDGREGLLCYGPYVPLPAGSSRICWRGRFDPCGGKIKVDVVADDGRMLLAEHSLSLACAEIALTVDVPEKLLKVEFRIWVSAEADAELTEIVIEPQPEAGGRDPLETGPICDATAGQLAVADAANSNVSPSTGSVRMPVTPTCAQTSDSVTRLLVDAKGTLRLNGELGALVPNEVFRLQVILENASDQTWSGLYNQPLALSYHWQDLAGNNVIFEGIVSPLPGSFVASGSSLPAVMRVQAPAQAGEYRLILMPVQEQLGWFDQFGFTPTILNVLVLQNSGTRRYLGNDLRLGSQCGTRVEQALVATGEKGFLIYGPYVALPSGDYIVRLDLAINTLLDGAWMDVCAAGGTHQFAKLALSPLANQATAAAVEFVLKESYGAIEVRFWLPAGCDLAVQSLLIEAVDECIVRTGIAAIPGKNFSLPELARISMTASCRDCSDLPKVLGAGQVKIENGLALQLMHEGTQVLAGGYYGDWMQTLIERLQGHHEPQEELLFDTLLKHVRPASLMVEFGCYWAFYSNWYLGAVPQSTVVCIEPDENHMQVGQQNIQLNHREAVFHLAAAGGQFQAEQIFVRESDRASVMVPVWDFAKLLEQIGTD